MLKQVLRVDRFRTLIRIRGACKNWLEVAYHVWRGQYPFVAISRDGGIKKIGSYGEILALIYPHTIVSVEAGVNKMIANIFNRELIIYGYVEGDLENVLVKEAYRLLDVGDKTVIDIGANIGDSCLYFALHGAKKVVGFEPYPRLFEFGLKNVLANHFKDIITIINAACGRRGHVKLDPSGGNVGTPIQYDPEGVDVPIFSLQEIAERFAPEGKAILKIDCEGCEYDVILDSPNEVLDRFDQIFVEYHHGASELINKLRNSGFSVSRSWPIRAYNAPTGKFFYIGQIIAHKKR